MRRFFLGVICTLIIILMMISVNASRGSDLVDEMFKNNSAEQQEVQSAVEDGIVNWEEYLGTDPEEIDFHLMYQCYNLFENNIVEAYYSRGNFASNISDSYFWIVPNFSKGGEVEVVSVKNSEHGWKIRGGSKLREDENNLKNTIVAVYDSIFSEFPNADAGSIRFFRCEYLNCNMVYFINNDMEYLQPHFNTDEYEWAKSGEIYTAESFIKTVKAEFSVDNKKEDAPFKFLRFFENNMDYFIVITLFVFACVIVLGIFIKKYKNKAAENDL